MQFINKQYKVIRLDSEDKYGASMLVEDTSRGHLLKKLRVINSKRETQEFIDYMKINLYDYKNFIHPNLAEFFYFNRINAIDRKPVLTEKYYCTTEFIEGEKFFDIKNTLNLEELLSIFIQLCSVVKYLHMRNYLLCNVNSNELYIKQENNNKTLKIASTPYLEGTKTAVMLDKDNTNFKSPEVMQDERYTRLSDVYLVGVLMLYIFSNSDINKIHFRDALASFNSNNDTQLNHIKKIIKKCTSLSPIDRYSSVSDIVKDINKRLKKQYNIVQTQYIEVFPRYMTKLISRENQIKHVLSNAKGFLYENKSIRATFIRGDAGTGKTAFLKTLTYRMEQEGIFIMLDQMKDEENTDFYVISNIIKEIIKYIDKDIVDKYAMDIAFLIPEITHCHSIKCSNDVQEKQSKCRLINRLGNFLLEAAIKLPFVISVNNFEWSDEASLQVFEYILKNENKGRIYLVLSVDPEVLEENVQNLDLFKAFKQSGKVDVVELGNLNINETAEYIRLVLGMENRPLDFAANIYKESEGNPKYIYEIIYLLFSNNYIYVNKYGNWVFNDVDYNSVKLSVNIDDIVLNKVNKLDVIQKEVIEVMSVFNTAISVDILECILSIKGEELFSILNYLSAIGILSRKVDDWGISFDFSSINLKKSIYQKIEKLKRQKYHEKLSFILEEKFEKENRENKDELIYHMTKANRYEEAIDYLLMSANKMISSNLLNQAIQFLEQTYSLFDKKEINNKKIMVCMKLGELYEQLGEYKKTEYFYDVVESIGLMLNNDEILLDIYIKKFGMLYRRNEIKKSLSYAISAKKLLKNSDDIEKLYELIIVFSDIAIFRRKYKSYIRILNKVINKSRTKENKIYYARLLTAYGRLLFNKGRCEESLNVLNESIDILEKLGSYKYMPVALNCIGVIYAEFYNDINKAKEFYEKSLSISQKMYNLGIMETSYNNLSEIYRTEDKLIKTLEFSNKALEVVEKSKNTFMKLVLNVNSILIYISLEDYKKAEEYINKAEKLFKNVKDTATVEEFLSRCMAEFYYVMGKFELANSYAQKAVDMCINWNISIDLEAEYIRTLVDIKHNRNHDFKDHIELCESIFNTNLYKLGRVACVKFAEIYAKRGFKFEAKTFLDLGCEYTLNIDSDNLKIEYEYIYALIASEKEMLAKLMDTAMHMDIIENNEIKCKINRSIADCFLCIGNNQEALKYYISALSYLRKLVHNVPDEYKVAYVISHYGNKIKEGLSKTACLLRPVEGKSNIQEVEICEDLNTTDDRKTCLDKIDKYFDYNDYMDIYRYSDIYDKGVTVDIDAYNKFLFKMKVLINEFTDDNVSNLRSIINMFAEITQAKNAFAATIDEEDNLNILTSYNRYCEIPFYKYIVEQVKQKKDSIIVTDAFEYSKKKGDILIPSDITSVFCIPIMGAKEEDRLIYIEDKRRHKLQIENHVIGYIYMDTDSIINNFTDETSNFCTTISKLSYILVDNYNLRIVSTIEKLTKLYTRKYFEASIINEITYAEKEGGEFSVLMIDIDKFKTVNDRFGHQKGDEILQNVSSIIMNTVRKGDICARYGGEEIIVLLPGTNSQSGYNVAEKIRKKIENAKLLGLHNPLTISVGVSSYPEHSTWVKDLIEKADQALYIAKESGRNMSCIYQLNMSKSVKRIDKLAGIISGNLVEDQRRVESMIEILELQKNVDLSFKEKIYKFLGRIIEVSESQTGIIIHLDKEESIKGKIARKKYIDSEVEEVHYSEEIIKKCIETKTGEYVIDWGNYPGIDSVTGMPDWQSIIVIPLIKKGRMMGLLYLSVSIKNKEFDGASFNFIKTLCDMISPIY